MITWLRRRLPGDRCRTCGQRRRDCPRVRYELKGMREPPPRELGYTAFLLGSDAKPGEVLPRPGDTVLFPPVIAHPGVLSLYGGGQSDRKEPIMGDETEAPEPEPEAPAPDDGDAGSQ